MSFDSINQFIVSEIMKNKAAKWIILLLCMLLMIMAGFAIYQSENSKREFAKSQFEIEKKRINNIDSAISTIYKDIYRYDYSNDTLVKLSTQRLIFLNKEREDALKKFKNITDETLGGDPLIFSLIVTLLVAILIGFFFSSFKSNASMKVDSLPDFRERRSIEKQKSIAKKNYEFLEWLINEQSQNRISEKKMQEIKIYKELFDFGDHLGDNKGKYLQIIAEYAEIKKDGQDVENEKYDEVYKTFSETQERLKDEGTRLNKQALINLFISFIMAFMLTSIMFYNSVLGFEVKGLAWPEFLMKFLPRLVSIVSLITIFLYFIRLYKTNIVDVKYYQNELTNIEQKKAAMRTAVNTQDIEIIKALIKDLSTAERNAIITKEQTSLNIERIKIENELNKDYLNKIWDVFTNFRNESDKKSTDSSK